MVLDNLMSMSYLGFVPVQGHDKSLGSGSVVTGWA